jgi:hypothetical protein
MHAPNMVNALKSITIIKTQTLFAPSMVHQGDRVRFCRLLWCENQDEGKKNIAPAVALI